MSFRIYQSLFVHILFVFHDVNTLSVEINRNVSGLPGDNRTEIECSYTMENVLKIDAVEIMVFNRSSFNFESIAAYFPSLISSLTPQGQYLRGRVTQMNITQSSTKAVMIFNKLMCIDDTFYKCLVRYTDSSLSGKVETSKNISIQVQVPPLKPDSVVWVKVSVDSSTTPAVIMHSTTLSSSTAVTTKPNETLSTLDSEEQNKTTAFNHSTIQTTGHNTTTSTASTISYRTSTNSIQQTTTALGIVEGDNMTVVCTGDVGKPPAKHVFQKYLNGKIVPMQGTVTSTSISEMSENCSYYRTSNLTFQVTAKDNNVVIRCGVNSSMTEAELHVETAALEVYSDISTTQSSSTGSSSGAYNTRETSPQSLDSVIGGVAGGAACVIIIIIVIACVLYVRKKRTSEKSTFKNEDKILVNSTTKPITQSRRGDYDDIALEEDTNKRQTVNSGHEIEDIKEHNKEYMKKQKEEEQKKNESNISPQPAVYAQVNEATKLKNNQNKETLEFVEQQEDGTCVETQEGINDKSGDRRHKENENVEHFDTSTNLSTHNSNGDTKSSKQTSQKGSYNNQAFEKDDNRKVATVSPTIRSSGGSQDDEQKNQNRHSQSKKGYENVFGNDRTDTSEGDTSHRTSL